MSATDTPRTPMEGLAVSVETVIDAGDGSKLFQVRLLIGSYLFSLCQPRADRLEAASLRRTVEDALHNVIASEVAVAGRALPLVREIAGSSPARIDYLGATCHQCARFIEKAEEVLASEVESTRCSPLVGERAKMRKQITDLERIKHDLEGRLFDALKTDVWLATGLEQVDHAMDINRGVYSRVLDIACVHVARVKELEAALAASPAKPPPPENVNPEGQWLAAALDISLGSAAPAPREQKSDEAQK